MMLQLSNYLAKKKVCECVCVCTEKERKEKADKTK